MALDRGTLAKVDRRVFAELDHTHGVQVAKVPVPDAVWSTWRRYCQAIGLTMGEGLAALIAHELETVTGGEESTLVLAEQADRHAAERTEHLDARERHIDTRAAMLRSKEKHLAEWEQRLRTTPPPDSRASRPAKVGRNERCPCGSGLKHKHCHGLTSR